MSGIVVLDYGTSNLRSVTRALEAVADTAHTVSVSAEPDTILAADKIVFPGQGAIGQCMSSIRGQGLDEVIRECIVNKPFLGICLGLQSLMEHSDENGGVKGLGILSGNVFRFADGIKDEHNNACKVPCIGWNRVYQAKSHPLWEGIEDGSRFYFDHSYYVKADLASDILGNTDYICRYASALGRDNFFAVQFHPEKSQRPGLTLLKNFIDWSGV